ncbi:MAG: radical SAM protein [Candidatus Latescibacteria bacterium]|nr:radical SAM protein [Candidatus Latescibacterota bacterium]
MDTITLDPVAPSLLKDYLTEEVPSLDRPRAMSWLQRSDRRLHPLRGSSTQEPDELMVVLIQSKNYDRDGYVNRYWRGVLPSNSLSVMYNLTEAAGRSINQRRIAEGKRPISIRPVAFDESVHKIDERKIIHMGHQAGKSALVGFVGVQTNQFPRALDLGRRFLEGGLDVLLGGFHVSGHPPSREKLKHYRIVPVDGEIDDVWDEILLDAITGDLREEYHVVGMPTLSHTDPPHLIPGYMDRFIFPFNTIDTSRGCPFNCSFCTVKNISGRTVRARSPEIIVQELERQYDELGINFVFFVDDDIARSPVWEPLFDGMITLREEKGKNIEFMMEVDTISYKIPRFVEKAARGGCTNVFIGVESLNQANIKLAAKSQNKVNDMKHMVDAWHEVGVFVHAGYIIGFANDTPSSVAENVEQLKEIGVDLASFFILMNLPGSDDYAAAVKAGVQMSEDFNIYDSFQVSTPHPNQEEMSDERWEAAYRAAWKSFYSVPHMIQSLSRISKKSYWGLLRDYIWYRLSIAEGQHPMNAGLFRLKDRGQRRPGFPQEGIGVHLRRRAKDLIQLIPEWISIYDDMRTVWLATRGAYNERDDVLNRWYKHSQGVVGQYRQAFAKRIDGLFENSFLWHLWKGTGGITPHGRPLKD